MKKVVVLGAGIAGLTCAYYLKEKYDVTILEKKSCMGGLCQSFEKEGFFFDYGGHVAFSKDDEVKRILENGIDETDEVGVSYNYKKGIWIKNPVQNNTYPLSTDEKVNIIKDFVNRVDDNNYENYEEWLRKKYGDYFAENYPFMYTRKYWTVEPKMMETKWVGIRMYTPSIEEVLEGAFTEKTPNVHYSGSVRYPNSGGFGKFLDNFSEIKNIVYDSVITKIDVANKFVYYNNTKIEFDELICTIPLQDIVSYIEDVPSYVKEAAKNLNYTSLVLVSVGVNKDKVMPKNSKAFYVYDEERLASRVYSTSEYGRNNAPEGCSTIQGEVYYSKFKPLNFTLEEVKEKVIQDFIDMGLFKSEEIVVTDVRQVEYANIIFTPDIYENRDIIHKFLDDNNILYAGRFGSWDYLWSDQTMLDAKRAAGKLL